MSRLNNLKLLIFCSSIIFSIIITDGHAKKVCPEGYNEQETAAATSDQQTLADEHFIVPVHVVDAYGNTEILKPNLVGLSNMAISFLPKNYHFENVIWATREVVAGVRYHLLVNAYEVVHNPNDPIVCELIILEKTWIIINRGGDKLRILRYSNCTSSENDNNNNNNNEPIDNRNNNNDYSFNPLFKHQHTEISDDMLKYLESQIITPKPKPTESARTTTSTTTTTQRPINYNENINTNNNNNNNNNYDDALLKYLESQIIQNNVVQRTTANSVVNQPQQQQEQNHNENSENLSQQIQPINFNPIDNMATVKYDTFTDAAATTINSEFIHPKPTDSPALPEQTQNNVQQNDNDPNKIENSMNLHQNTKEEIYYTNESNENKPKIGDDDNQQQLTTPTIEGIIILTNHQINDQINDRPMINSNEMINIDVQQQQQQQQQEQYDDYQHHTVVVNEQRNKRDTSTGSVPAGIHTEKQYYLSIVERALEQLDHIDNDDYKRIPLEILSMKKIENINNDLNNKGVVITYGFKVKIGNSHCIEETSTNIYDCKKSLVKSSTKICLMEIQVKQGDTVNVINSQCLPVKSHLKKRQTLVGAPVTITDSEEVKNLTENVISKLSTLEDGAKYDFLRIVKATKKIVSGVLYDIQAEIKVPSTETEICNIKVWTQPWIKNNGTEITVHCDGKETVYRQRRALQLNDITTNKKEDSIATTQSEIVVEKVRNKRGAKGAPKDVSNDPEIEEKTKNILAKFSTLDGGQNYSFSRILNATKQTVQGSLYKIVAEIKLENDETKTCTFRIWERLWIDDGTEITINCGDKEHAYRQRRSLFYDRNHNRNVKTTAEIKAEHMFNKFKIQYKRDYKTTLEHDLRFRIFQNNLLKIKELNEREQGTAKYGISEFSDFTSHEYRQRTGLWKRNKHENEIPSVIAKIPENIELPKEFDWRTKNAITDVKNQGNCGSCWAFSVTGNIEGLHAIKTGVLEEYSEQELLDCDAIDGACQGGLPDNAYKAIEQIGGLELENEYPYKAKKLQCHFNKTMSHVQVKGFVDLPKNETAMAQWLIENGPISIGINANAMQFYRGGVSHPWRALCRHSTLDHGVLIVGYGVSDYPVFNKTLPYWIVKNSWGPKWGEQGYYRIYRGDNSCGINSMASSAVLA